jgi:hypothetical protein
MLPVLVRVMFSGSSCARRPFSDYRRAPVVKASDRHSFGDGAALANSAVEAADNRMAVRTSPTALIITGRSEQWQREPCTPPESGPIADLRVAARSAVQLIGAGCLDDKAQIPVPRLQP